MSLRTACRNGKSLLLVNLQKGFLNLPKSIIGMQRINFSSGSPWEEIVGYSRTVRVDNVIEVSGTTASENGTPLYPGDYYHQTQWILQKVKSCIEQAGGRMEHVIRSRIFVCDISKWEEVARAHAEFFHAIKPAATMVEVSRLIAPGLDVEIEVSAYVTADK
jgi:enamine deaminase RidA (YjgF/YER057c/UK114 family)